MKKVKLLITQKHPKGNIKKGSVYNWNEKTNIYEFYKDGNVISTINESGVDAFSQIFKRI